MTQKPTKPKMTLCRWLYEHSNPVLALSVIWDESLEDSEIEAIVEKFKPIE